MSPDQGDGKPKGPDPSDVVDNVTKVADSKVMTLLLGRVAQAVGDYWGEKVEDYFKKLRDQSREKNVKDHVSKVVEVTGAHADQFQEIQVVRLEKWVKVAADIPVEDVERSAIIEAVLENIVSKVEDASEFQEVSEKLTSGTARLLLNAPAEQSILPKEADERGFEQLKSLGLAGMPGQSQRLNNVGAWLVGTIVGLILLFSIIARYGPSLFPRFFPSFLAIQFVAEAVVISALIVGFGIAFISKRYQLTQLGKSLQRSAKRFYGNESKVQKKLTLPAFLRRPRIVCGGLATFFVCVLPFALQAYLPLQLRINESPPTVIISSLPGTPSKPPPPSAPNASSPTSPQQQATLTADDVRTLVNVWRSVADQMNDILALTNDCSVLLPNWPQRIKDGQKQALASELSNKRDAIQQRRESLASLYTAYQTYPNVSAVQQGARDFDRLYRALDSFVHVVQTLRTPPPENVENLVRPYADELKGALDAMAKWANGTRDFAQRQSDELSQINLR
jgi:hypothetical protein